MSATQISPEVVASPEAGTAAANRWRNGVLCAVLVAGCLWAAWPVSGMGFDDDWSYARTAQVFANTGHFVYNGWATAMLGWQVVWGALFIKVFGFSFTILRVSMLPIAMASVFLFHEILRGFGVNSRNAVIGTLTLGLSPLFMPLADSFMTDIPGLFVLLLCFYCCQRAIASPDTRTAMVWLIVGTASNIAGGTVRQIAWLGALVMVPSAGWMLRRKRGIIPLCIVLWLASAVSISGLMLWFYRQPWSVPEFPLSSIVRNPLYSVLAIALNVGALACCCMLLVYPVLVAWVPVVRRFSTSTLRKLALLLPLCVVTQLSHSWSMPWLRRLLLLEFSTDRSSTLAPPSFDSFLLPFWARVLAGSAVIATGLLLALYIRRGQRRGLVSTVRQFLERSDGVLIVPYCAVYLLLLCTHACNGAFFDRYGLGLLPFLILELLLLLERRTDLQAGRSSIVVLAAFALLGIAGTHDLFAWQRARGAAIDEVIASGIPRNEIQGGVEYDGWTQVANGDINDPRIQVPAGTYHPVAPDGIPKDCELDFAKLTPSVHPQFTADFDPRPCFAPSGYSPVHYTTWLPPYRRTVYVQKIIRK